MNWNDYFHAGFNNITDAGYIVFLIVLALIVVFLMYIFNLGKRMAKGLMFVALVIWVATTYAGVDFHGIKDWIDGVFWSGTFSFSALYKL
ncbi:hypothetical protein [Paenibacillus glycanilyticus]|uniref:hypothetical protein n=1 Tax=Paenibacillus glycanilyticus TaxID=126569 RepID=UPI001910D3BD|nr:hypothetical protein [Paenibacillus glycanilyticus]